MIQFEKINNAEIKKKPSYLVSTTILNKKNEFTADEIFNEVHRILEKELKEEKSKIDLKTYTMNKLEMLCNNGLVMEHGSRFSVRYK